MEKLRNLKQICGLAAGRFTEYEGKDFELPQMFKEEVKEINSNSITYNKYSAVIETRGNQNGELKIFLPNQWFYIASYFTDFYNELQRYKKEALKVVSKERLKLLNGSNLTDDEMYRLKNLSLDDTSKSYLVRFITDYSWWSGAKTIDRGDFYVSPILNSARLVNASQSFVADLCAFLADKTDLVNAIIKGEEIVEPTYSKFLIQNKSISSFAYNVFRFLEKKDNLKAFEKLVAFSKADNYDGEPLIHLQSKDPNVRLVNVFIEKEGKPSQTYYYNDPFDFNGRNVYLNNGWANDRANRPDLTLNKLAIIVNECYGPDIMVIEVDGHYELLLNRKKLIRPFQQIYFGTPGSGKSWTIKQKYEQDETKVFRTTFHPDTDYASFVGCYKPVKDEDDDKKIVYKFVPQAFTDVYVAAWSDLEHPYYLIIEEINRGNCAQIFGDLFQLLDRNKDGYSEYPIKADHDLKDYLVEHLSDNSEGIRDGKLCLPPNLNIIASMNTSDQSLFPMDSAFKRRWSWEYVPIDYENAESGAFTIMIGGETRNWHKFLKAVNEKIKTVTSSEDKQMGNFFIKRSVDEKEFCDKVMFYLWSEVGKDNYQTNDAIFRYYAEEDKLKEFSFNELYDHAKRTAILKGFIRYIEEEKQ